jgi:hypothetical protein
MILSASGRASAEPITGEVSLELTVGKTTSYDVGFARGLQCDDLAIVHAELRADSPTSNRLFITGLHAGATACRAGTLGAPSLLVHVTVK